MFGYAGPGLGAGAGAIVLGFFLTLFSFLVAIFWIPLKRLFKFIFKKKKQNSD